MLKYHLITYGCRMNKSDSERIDSMLQSANFKPASKSKADILIINVCSVRQSAVDRVWGQIQQINKTIKQKNKSIVVLTGCILPADKNKFKNKVDLILNIADLAIWPKVIINKIKEANQLPITNYQLLITKLQKQCHHPNYFSITPKRQSSFSAYVPIMTGCNNFCSYCVVPYVRGREQSRPVEDILAEVYKLIIQGYKEIILLGQNVNSYKGKISKFQDTRYKQFPNSPPTSRMAGLRRAGKFPAYVPHGRTSAGRQISKNTVINFPRLLKLIDFIPGNYWLNFVSSHPKDLSDELIKCYKTLKHLTPYLHLALQSGSNKILKKMNRHYTANDYLKLINKIKKINPKIAITTDIIVGFSSETKKDFEATAKLMQKIKFDMAYIAQYSPRAHTSAVKLKDNVSKIEKKKREKILTEILKKTALTNNKKLIGQIIEVLITEGKEKQLEGKTNAFKHVKIEIANSRQAAKSLIGKFIKVKITQAGAWGLTGKLIKK